jgi:hypothetical protein
MARERLAHEAVGQWLTVTPAGARGDALPYPPGARRPPRAFPSMIWRDSRVEACLPPRKDIGTNAEHRKGDIPWPSESYPA